MSSYITPPRVSDSDFIEEQPKEVLAATASRSPHRPMPNSRPIARRLAAPIPKTSSGEKMCMTSADENLHAETAHRLSSSPHAAEAAAPTSNEGKSRRKMSRTRQKKSRLTRSCRNHTITDHRHRCHASQHTEPSTCHQN
jgi:hypothetical protein